MVTAFVGYTRDQIRQYLKKQKINFINLTDVDVQTLNERAQSFSFIEGVQNYLVFEFPKNANEAEFLKNEVFKNSAHNFYFEALCGKTVLPKKIEILVNENKTKKLNDSSVFDLSNAIFSGSVSDVWQAYLKLKKQTSIEEMHGTFLWAVKTILSARDKNLRPTISSFVLSKIDRAGASSLVKAGDSVLLNYYKQSVSLATRAHLGEIDFEKAFEKLILEMPKSKHT